MKNALILVNESIHAWNLHIHKESQETLLSHVSSWDLNSIFFLNSCRAIVKYTLSKQLGSSKLLKVGWTITEYLFHCVEFSDCHLVLCESSRLISTDGVRTTHSL